MSNTNKHLNRLYKLCKKHYKVIMGSDKMTTESTTAGR